MARMADWRISLWKGWSCDMGAQIRRAGCSFDEGQRSISKAESDVGLVLMNLPAEAFAQYRLFTACISRR